MTDIVQCPDDLSQDQQDAFWMAHALELAKKAEQQGEVPVGAVIVRDNQLVSEGWNQTIQAHDATAHAEIVALRQAGLVENNYRLPGSTLYVTLEPCPMCAGALVHARVDRIVIATQDPRTGAAGSLLNLLQHDSLNHQANIIMGVLQTEASDLLSSFFRRRRAEQKQRKQKTFPTQK